MTTLVLCIDRDNDLGRKTGIASPVVGREANRRAAEALALADPEESDVNCMYSALSTYDDLEGDSAIATIGGSSDVGPISDKLIADRLDQVISEVQPDGVILVTDGDEDEYVLPLIRSRTKIDAVKRVVVKQSETLEGTYYLISRFMEDERMQRRFMLPLALVLVIWGLSSLLGSPAWGFATVLLVLGAYLLTRVFHLEGFFTRLGREIYSGLRSGRISLFANLLAAFILIAALLSAFNVVSTMQPAPQGVFEFSVRFLHEITWWFVAAALISVGGRFTDIYFKEKQVLWSYVILPFSLLAFGLIFSASTDMLIKIAIQSEPLQSLLTLPFLSRIIEGVLIGFIGTVIYHIAEDMYSDAEPEEPEKD